MNYQVKRHEGILNVYYYVEEGSLNTVFSIEY